MAFDEYLASAYRDALSDREGITEKRMMGGVCFFHNGNMIGGADREKDGKGRYMPAWRGILSQSDVEALVSYIRLLSF